MVRSLLQPEQVGAVQAQSTRRSSSIKLRFGQRWV